LRKVLQDTTPTLRQYEIEIPYMLYGRSERLFWLGDFDSITTTSNY